jgi:hypothetical protein
MLKTSEFGIPERTRQTAYPAASCGVSFKIKIIYFFKFFQGYGELRNA